MMSNPDLASDGDLVEGQFPIKISALDNIGRVPRDVHCLLAIGDSANIAILTQGVLSYRYASYCVKPHESKSKCQS
jgi:hypothetical protein